MGDDPGLPPAWSLTPRTRRTVFVLAIIAIAALIGSLIVKATPWPSALLIRAVFEKGAQDTIDEMAPYVPDLDYRITRDLVYGDRGADTSLDVILPPAASGADSDSDSDSAGSSADTAFDSARSLPLVVWIHGGAWISGDKTNVEPYLKILASEGYATAGLNYTLAPEAAYPTAITQLNEALGYLSAHAQELGIDPQRIVLAGDSAGAQLASQLAALTTNPDYAAQMGLEPTLRPDQLAGVILNCGVYDLRAMSDLDGIVAWGFKVSLWAATGTKNWSATAPGTLMSTIGSVTADFPPTYISGGNGDGLTWIQSVPMSIRLQDAGVEVDSLFWPADHEPSLPHEYHFHLDYPEAHEALARTLAFLGRVTAPAPAAAPATAPAAPAAATATDDSEAAAARAGASE